MPGLGGVELMIIVVYLLLLLVPAAVLYFIIRQALLSALRKFYRELDPDEVKQKAKAAI